MQTVVNLHGGFHLDIFPVILAALVFFIVIYLITWKKNGKASRQDLPSRNETYHFMYGQLLEKETTASK
jgi:hypothetical protein